MKRIKGRSGRVITLFLLLGLSLVGLSLVLARPPAVTAAAVPVTNTDDSGPGSLRAAISSAMSGDNIVFSLPANSTITLTSGELLINTNLTIDGTSTSGLTVQRSTAGGTPDFRIFNIASGNFNVTVSGLTISNGKAPDFGSGGGGILNLSTGTVNITNCTINGNSAQRGGGGGGVNNGGDPEAGFAASIGTVNIAGCIISNNSAPSQVGGGIFNAARNDGTGTVSTSTVNITNSTISGNSAVFGGGIFNGSAPPMKTLTVNVTNSSISGNTLPLSQGGAGIYNDSGSSGRVVLNITTSTVSGNSSGDGTAGGIFNGGDTVNVTNSTISGNSAGRTGGIENENKGTVNITDCTISSNSTSVSGGGGLTNGNGTVNLKNSIIAGNSDTSASPPSNHPDLSGAFTSQGYNLIGNNSGATITPTTGDQIGTPAAPIDPLLGPLQNNGGPTFTHALLSGSPATDKGSAATDPVTGNPITTDQRGFTRPVDDPAIPNAPGGDGSDIGAFEEQMPTGVPCTLTCPANVTQPNDPNHCGAVVNYSAPTTSGTCGTVTCSPLSGSFFPKGTTTVTCSEPGGASCSFSVTVNDDQAPVLSGCNNVNANTASNACTAVVSYTQPAANDNCDGVRPVTCSPSSGSTFNKGVTTVTCTASDLNTPANTGSCTFTVTVNDTQHPSVTCPNNITFTTPGNNDPCAVVTYTTPTGSDNCAVQSVVCNPPSGTCFPVGMTTVTCTATDTSNNTGQCTFKVTVQNPVQNPCTITCPANQTASTGPGATRCGAVANYPAPTTTGPGCGTVACSPVSGSFFPVGMTTVTCTTTAGPSCTFKVTVSDNTPPVFSSGCPAAITLAAQASCPFAISTLVNFATPTATDNCSTVTVVCNPPSGSMFPVGTITVTCTATDASNNTAQCTFTVTTFSMCLQDETNTGNFVLVNPATGDYVFFCNGVQIASGKGTLNVKGCAGSIEHDKGDRRALIVWDTTANGGKGAGTASIQVPVNNTRCAITDKDMSNDTCAAPGPVSAPERERQPRQT